MIHERAGQRAFSLPNHRRLRDITSAPIPRALLALSCRHRGKVGTTVSRADGSHCWSVGSSISSNFAIPGAGATITAKASFSTRCGKSYACAINGRRLRACRQSMPAPTTRCRCAGSESPPGGPRCSVDATRRSEIPAGASRRQDPRLAAAWRVIHRSQPPAANRPISPPS